MVRHIEALPDGPQVGALFDFDGTLIAGFSAPVFLKEQFGRGDVNPVQAAELVTAITQFSIGVGGFSGIMTAAAKLMRGMSVESYREFGQRLYEQQIAAKVYPEARAIVEAHLAKGHTVAIVSSATPYQVEPAAADLGIEHVMCSHYETAKGEFTGNILRPLCFGDGKVMAAESFAKKRRVNLKRSCFYSDSSDDIELLERVGFPRVLNPDRKLNNIAQRRGWPVQRFTSRGNQGLFGALRRYAVHGSLVAAYLAAIPVWAITGSRREAQNFAWSYFADISSALVGLKLDVTGEQYMWAQRPAVFVFNHQSQADIMVVAKLVRRDLAGIGKQEIRSIPLLGWILESAGVVFVDRSNTSSAIAAMRPLVHALQKDRKSVLIAPEGTRTESTKLAPFKKGAFHLAASAGVPIVPIVIHNARDVQPKGDEMYYPATVKVDVLPPVDTGSWKSATMGEHIAEVRSMFLTVLGQEEDEVTIARAKTRKKKPRRKKPQRRARKREQ